MTVATELTKFESKIRALERELARLESECVDPAAYFRRFVDETVAVLGVGGAVWELVDASRWERTSHINLSRAGLDENGSQLTLLAQALSHITQTAEPVILSSQNASNLHDGGMDGNLANTSPFTLLFMPVIVQGRLFAVYGLIAPQDIDSRALSGLSSFVQSLCEKAGRYLEQLKINELRMQVAKSNRMREYVSSLHSNLDPERACYALANYAQEMLGSFRCMAGVYTLTGKFHMHAISGLESVAVKSSFIRSISAIARRVCGNGKPLLVDNPNAALSAGVDRSDDLLTEARLYMLGAKTLWMGIFPIFHEQRVVGALVVEKARDESLDEDQRRHIEALGTQASVALHNCLVYREIPLGRVIRPLARLKTKFYTMGRVRAAVWTTFLATLLLAPMVITRPVKVVGSAELIPMDAQVVFARQDGVVEELLVESGQRVTEGDILARLDTRLIDSQLNHVNKAINQASLGMGMSRNNQAQYRIHESQYELSRAEKEELLKERDLFMIRAPISGILITRDSELRQLQDKPIARGDEVFEIVPDQTPWHLAVHIPENEAGEFLVAWDRLDPGQTLSARVILNAYPDVTFRTHVLSVAPRAHVLTTGPQRYQNVIEVLVAEPEDFRAVATDPRPGLEGKVAFACTERNLYYVLSHKFIHFVRVKFF